MKCQICGEKLGEYECSVCGKIVCEDHYKTIKGKVYCINHVPGAKEETKKPGQEKLSGIKKAIATVVILMIAVIAVYFILNSVVSASPLFSDIIPLLTGFTSLVMLILSGLTGILVLLIIFYVAVSRKLK